MRRVARGAVLVIWLGACGSGAKRQADSSGAPAGSDRSGDMTGFVFDLMDQHTSDDELPVAYEQFAALPDPDSAADQPDVYAPMFRASSATISSPDE
jgi:hypothetical protein